jgi:hypothetical protein
LHLKNVLIGCIAGLAVAASVFGGIKTAEATPATLGFYPATDIYGKGNFHLDVDTYGRATKMDGVTSFGLTYGIGPERDGLFGRSEIGADYINTIGGSTPTDAGGDTLSGSRRLLFNAKTQLYNNDDSGVRVVGGFWGVGSDSIAAPNVGYLLASKSFSWGRVHAGVAHAFDKANITAGNDDDTTYLQLGYDRMLTKKVQFAMDAYSGKSFVSGIQPTLYYYVNDKASFGLGVMHFWSKNVQPRNQVYLCFDYNFGGGSSDAADAPEVKADATDNKGAEPGAPAATP